MAIRIPPKVKQPVQESLPWYEEMVASAPAVGAGIAGTALGAAVGGPVGASAGGTAGYSLGSAATPSMRGMMADTTMEEVPGQEVDLQAAADAMRQRRRARFEELQRRWA